VSFDNSCEVTADFEQAAGRPGRALYPPLGCQTLLHNPYKTVGAGNQQGGIKEGLTPGQLRSAQVISGQLRSPQEAIYELVRVVGGAGSGWGRRLAASGCVWVRLGTSGRL
jgi:hypothetical protein